ncbi:hypothetical protein N7465_000503 [Penicillium sp. CMV-2018d]|nr:hypothetical protein N7465_000503 [Penicillium sp. CMV-2018d]
MAKPATSTGMLENQTIIITGTASGIGLAATTAALNEGARVFGVDLTIPPETLQQHRNFKFLQCDLTGVLAADDVVSACTEAYGARIDALVNVAGVMDHYGSVDTLADEMWEKCLAVNLTAPVKLMRAVIPFMRGHSSGGSIVNVASKAGLSGGAGGVAYTASKHGLIGATKNVAWRFKGENIRCNVICPGAVATGMINGVKAVDIDKDALASMQPVLAGHLADGQWPYIGPEEIAHTLIFLASNLSARISGSVIPIDNAWSTM